MMYDEIIVDRQYQGLNPVTFGYEDCEPGHSFGPAVRTYWLLHYVVSGCGKFHYGGDVYPVKQGEMFVIPPMETTFYEADEKNPWEYIWVGFEAEELPVKLKPVIRNERLLRIFKEMKKCSSMGAAKNAFLSGKLWELFSELLLDTPQNEPGYVEQAIGYMEAEYMHEIRIDRLAERLHIDRSYFSAIFREKTGMSPQGYLTKLRLEKAAELMTRLGQSPSTAAVSSGYNDICNFSKMFKKYYGASPRAYISRAAREKEDKLN